MSLSPVGSDYGGVYMGFIRRVSAVVLGLSFAAHAGTAFQATTTLTAETANNTSAADSFTTQTNGNNGASNISKVSTHNLLYPGATGKVYAHLMLWFGGSNHMNVGYTSDSTTQVHKQVTDMISRGIDGTIIDWYGQGTNNQGFTNINQATQYVMEEAVLHPNFTFAVMDDAGSLQACAKTSGCDVTQTLINDLTYAYNNYEGSSAYLRYNGQPVVYFFGEESYTIDWSRVRSSVPGNPLFIFRNTGGFTYAQSNGAFSWVAPETVSSTDPMALNYLDNFDQTAISKWPTYSTESGYKGFNDSLASWGSGRLINQNCGQTWFTSIAQSAKYFSTSKQMLGIQLVTWNDYEEGTEIESGIDNCVTISASVSGTVASWTITGQSNTLDHYSVFVSQDGENLMWLADVPVSSNSLDLAQFNLNAGNYQVFIKAVGQPSITNKISAGVSLTVPDLSPVVVLNVSPTSGNAPVNVTASTSGSYTPLGSVASTVINFGDGSAPVSAITATHTYTVAGTFTVTATVTDNLGTASSKTATVKIATADLPPVALISVSPASGYGPLTVSASTAGSYDPDGTTVTSSINFGDGSSSAGPTASHTYSAAGSYTLIANVTDTAGLSSQASTVVTVKAPEVIVTTPANGALTISPVQVVATGFSGYPVNAMQIYLDGTLNYNIGSATLNTSVVIAPGAHTLVVKGWDSSGRSFMKSLSITIDQPVAAISVTPASLLVGSSVTASSAASTDPFGSISASLIDFGDGTVVSAATATHQYKTAGTFTVKTTVTDNLGASATASTSVTVKPQYVVISSPTGGTITSSTVQVIGTAYSGYPVVSTQVYLDGVLKYQISASSVNISLKIPGGTHLIVVQGWDSSGATFKAGVTVTR
jgi:PKD repeat protein